MRRFWSAGALLLMTMQVGCGSAYASARETSAAGAAGPEPGMPMSPPADSYGVTATAEPAPEEASGTSDMVDGVADERTAMAKPAVQPSPPQAPGRGPPPPPVQAPTPTGPAKGAPGTQPVAGQPSSTVAQPMLIYTAEITMAVFEVSGSLSQIEDLGREVGGFLSRRDDHTITIRVPAGRFDEAVKRIEKIGDVLHRNVSAQDVTEEFADLDVRLRNARAIRDRLEILLAKSNKVEESLLIERELGRVAGEIERLEGRMKFLRDRAAYSTITVRFQPRPTENVTTTKPRLPVPWLYEMGLGRLLNL